MVIHKEVSTFQTILTRVISCYELINGSCFFYSSKALVGVGLKLRFS